MKAAAEHLQRVGPLGRPLGAQLVQLGLPGLLVVLLSLVGLRAHPSQAAYLQELFAESMQLMRTTPRISCSRLLLMTTVAAMFLRTARIAH